LNRGVVVKKIYAGGGTSLMEFVRLLDKS
jgi:hypothetical protein